MLEILLGGASGGILGVLGALLKNGLEVYQKNKEAQTGLAIVQEQNKHELLMADKQLEQIKFEAQNSVTIADLNMRGELEKSADSVFEASFANDKASYSTDSASGWMLLVDVYRGITRPNLTNFFVGFLAFLTVIIWYKLPAEVVYSQDFLKATLYKLIDLYIFLGGTVVGWWFGASPTRKV